MLTNDDYQKIEKIVDTHIDTAKEEIKEQIRHLPSRDDFDTRMDKLTKEIQDAREELAAHAMSHERLDEKDEELETRVSVVEKKLRIPSSGSS
ncbi:hypothetical protein A2971_03855 [Candidatus Gottesmanbacteria bacterium RIFCSPLOWO2_01_FULL_46_21]|uniref:Uncharacterized protein n=1 Tax=Candidatus Gottesmanbacteria bacterium RIFCSPLOWO2_01_FULL_46_21 TaxID=1798393 RepID=A0A1F6AXS4_9BACT|nr:MAG: hypothetical protein A2971_03855 [Candidatus Gottesmanbacteria bacterium RIFCSPLOWO2_01_FULL_46_21]